MLGNASSRVQKMLYRVFDEVAPYFSFVLAVAFLQLIFSSGGSKKKTGSISEDLETPSPIKVLRFLNVDQFANQFRIMKKSSIAVHYIKGNSIALLVQRFMKAWAAVRERRGLGS